MLTAGLRPRLRQMSPFGLRKLHGLKLSSRCSELLFRSSKLIAGWPRACRVDVAAPRLALFDWIITAGLRPRLKQMSPFGLRKLHGLKLSSRCSDLVFRGSHLHARWPPACRSDVAA